MNANDYQMMVLRTAPKDQGKMHDMINASLGLTGEAGEVSDMVKKIVYHQHPIDETALIKELGDICWYVAFMAHTLNVDLSEVMEANIEKLTNRYPKGFNPEDSINRKE